MATRADHYVWADELVWKARRHVAQYQDGAPRFDGVAEPDWQMVAFDLAAAQVHATLAAVPASVEEQVSANELGASQAVAATENRFYRAPIRSGICIECGGGPSGLHRVMCSHSRKGPQPAMDDPGHPK